VNFFRVSVFLACVVSSSAADYATYIGDAYAYTVNAIAVDPSGNTYATGYRTVVFSSAGSTASDVFVTKVDGAGNVTLLATLSGKGSDQGNGIAVDSSGNIYVVGQTTSPDFPLLNPLQSAMGEGPGSGSGFLTKLAPNGSIVYSTYLGGTMGASAMNAVAVDAQGSAYLTGSTFAPDYPHTAGLPNDGAFSTVGGVAVAFFAKISPAGKILYAGGIGGVGHACGVGSSCFTSTLSTSGVAIALDPTGNAYIAGNTNGVGLHTTPGALNSTGIGAFVFQVNAAGTALGYSTLLGSANYAPPPVATSSEPGNTVNGIAVDAVGNAFLTDWTEDSNFPATAGAFQSKPSFTVPTNNPYIVPPSEAFVAKLNPSGTAMVWASFLGASSTVVATRIALDAADNVWVTGASNAADFPATSGFPGGGEFVTEFNATGSALLYSTRVPVSTAIAGLAIGATGLLHLAGATGLVSTLTPSLNSGPTLFGVANAAAGALGGRVAPSELISIYGLNLGISSPMSSTFNSAGYLPTTLAGIQVTIGGIAAPLLYVSNTQINALVPGELTVGSSVSLQVSNGAASMPVFRVVVDQAIPGVFGQNGTAAAINQDGTVNSAAHPAPSGSIVSVWATGTGYAPGADGQMATAAQQTCSCAIVNTVQGTSFSATYAGAAPGMVNGVVQINFTVSSLNGIGASYLLSANGTDGYPFQLYVQP
jgi:uncharacterized protein (TIGR03437 family)